LKKVRRKLSEKGRGGLTAFALLGHYERGRLGGSEAGLARIRSAEGDWGDLEASEIQGNTNQKNKGGKSESAGHLDEKKTGQKFKGARANKNGKTKTKAQAGIKQIQ